MAFDPEFLDLMSTVASYEQFSTNDAYAEPSFLAVVDLTCHVTYKRKIIRSDSEEDRVSTAQVQCPPPGWVIGTLATPTITIYDRIILPVDGVERKIIDVTFYTDEDGVVHHQSASLE